MPAASAEKQKYNANRQEPITGPRTATPSIQRPERASMTSTNSTIAGEASAIAILNGTIPLLTAPRFLEKSADVVPGSTPRIAALCVTATTAPSTAVPTSHAIPTARRQRISAIATTTPAGTMPSTSGVHRPIATSAPRGTRNHPSTRADRMLRADRQDTKTTTVIPMTKLVNPPLKRNVGDPKSANTPNAAAPSTRDIRR